MHRWYSAESEVQTLIHDDEALRASLFSVNVRSARLQNIVRFLTALAKHLLVYVYEDSEGWPVPAGSPAACRVRLKGSADVYPFESDTKRAVNVLPTLYKVPLVLT